jgi:hypothetical protein
VRHRTRARAKQHFVLDDVADARKDRMIEQDVCDLLVRVFAYFLQRRGRRPLI